MAVNFQKGKFNVKSQTGEGNKHLVGFSTPRCSCEAWRKTQYPRKHFFAVFSAYKEWSFDSVPDAYKNSVFSTVDIKHLKIPPEDNSNLSSTTMKSGKQVFNMADVDLLLCPCKMKTIQSAMSRHWKNLILKQMILP